MHRCPNGLVFFSFLFSFLTEPKSVIKSEQAFWRIFTWSQLAIAAKVNIPPLLAGDELCHLGKTLKKKISTFLFQLFFSIFFFPVFTSYKSSHKRISQEFRCGPLILVNFFIRTPEGYLCYDIHFPFFISRYYRIAAILHQTVCCLVYGRLVRLAISPFIPGLQNTNSGLSLETSDKHNGGMTSMVNGEACATKKAS